MIFGISDDYISDLICLGTFALANLILYYFLPMQSCAIDLYPIRSFALTNIFHKIHFKRSFGIISLSITNLSLTSILPYEIFPCAVFIQYDMLPNGFIRCDFFRLETFAVPNILPYELYNMWSSGIRAFSYEHLAYEHYPCDLSSGHRPAGFVCKGIASPLDQPTGGGPRDLPSCIVLDLARGQSSQLIVNAISGSLTRLVR